MRNTPARNMRYSITATLSEEAVHERLICELETAVAVKAVGSVGGTLSLVVDEAAVDCAEQFPAASQAATV